MFTADAAKSLKRLDAAAMMPVTAIDALIFRGQSSGAGMTLRLENEQGADTFGNTIVTFIDQILCEAVGSCAGTPLLWATTSPSEASSGLNYCS